MNYQEYLKLAAQIERADAAHLRCIIADLKARGAKLPEIMDDSVSGIDPREVSGNSFEDSLLNLAVGLLSSREHDPEPPDDWLLAHRLGGVLFFCKMKHNVV